MQYVYMLRTRECIRLNETTYKIGKTTRHPDKRMREYPNGSEVIIILRVSDCSIVEGLLKSKFKELYTQERLYGVEYFSGDINNMVETFTSIASQYKHIIPFDEYDYTLPNHIAFLRYPYTIYKKWCVANNETALGQDRFAQATDDILEAVAYTGNLEAVKWLVETNTEQNQYNNAMYAAAYYGHLNIVKYLSTQYDYDQYDYEYALDGAAEYGNLPMIKWLVNKTNEFEFSMEAAVKNKHAAVVRVLAKNIDTCPQYIITAAKNGDIKTLQLLSNTQKDVNQYYMRSIIESAKINNIKIIKYICNNKF
jgi:hypothetical protein